ncbi:hypothetical protein ABLE91_04620 [Aquabacter sp. CN5-332]|uniref:hypothetical protein n=1 Tax=Aquabacter sp. CN5-332 TaxID=3156608 RepID=UPI0032B472BB
MKLLALILLLVLGAASVRAQPAAQPPVLVRTTLAPPSGAVIGQHVRLFVDVLFPGDMPHPPRIALPDVPGAQVLRFETQGTTMGDTVGGVSYTGQRFEFALYPRRGGTLMIPPAKVTVLDRAGDITGTVQGESLQTEISVPPGVSAATLVIATDSLTLRETWSPDPASSFKAGDAITRTIVRRAADIPALAMRDLPFTAPAGIRVYVQPPGSDDHLSRGDLTGERTDRVTYVFETGGSFVIPAVSQPWWDLDGKVLKVEEGRGISIIVAAVPPSEETRPFPWLLLWLAAALLLAVCIAVMCLRSRIRIWIAAWQERRHGSEAAAFRDLLNACKAGEAATTYAAFRKWKGRLPSGAAEATSAIVRELERSLFRGDGNSAWSREDGYSMAQALRAWRRQTQDQHRAHLTGPLPPLNPSRN